MKLLASWKKIRQAPDHGYSLIRYKSSPIIWSFTSATLVVISATNRCCSTKRQRQVARMGTSAKPEGQGAKVYSARNLDLRSSPPRETRPERARPHRWTRTPSQPSTRGTCSSRC
jgi:hypothetical protein